MSEGYLLNVVYANGGVQDCLHAGNGIPCRYYNHGGCRRGSECTYSHAPDDKSVRDDMYVPSHSKFCYGANFDVF